MFYLPPIPMQFTDPSGVPYTGGTVHVYLTGTTSRANIYADSQGTALAENPVHLDSTGACKFFVPADVSLDYIVWDEDENPVFSYTDVILAGGGQPDVTKEYVDEHNEALQSSILDLSDALQQEVDRATGAEAASKTEVTTESSSLTIEKTTSPTDGHDIYKLTPQEVNVTSVDESVTVNTTTVDNQKTIDLSLNEKAPKWGHLSSSDWITISDNTQCILSDPELVSGTLPSTTLPVGLYDVDAELCVMFETQNEKYIEITYWVMAGETELCTGTKVVDGSVSDNQKFGVHCMAQLETPSELTFVAQVASGTSNFKIRVDDVFLHEVAVGISRYGGNSLSMRYAGSGTLQFYNNGGN